MRKGDPVIFGENVKKGGKKKFIVKTKEEEKIRGCNAPREGGGAEKVFFSLLFS